MAGKITQYPNTRTTFTDDDLLDVSASDDGGTSYESQKTTYANVKTQLNSDLSFLSSGDNVSLLTNDAGYVTSNIYTSNDTLTSDRTVSLGGFGLGIGTAPVAGKDLTVGGDVQIGGKLDIESTTTIGTLGFSTAIFAQESYFADFQWALAQYSDGTTRVNAPTGASVELMNQFNVKAVIDGNGVGIGTVGVSGKVLATEGALQLKGSTFNDIVATGNYGSGVGYGFKNLSGTLNTEWNIYAQGSAVSGNAAREGDLGFWNNSGTTTVMVLTKSGDLGVGLPSGTPTAKLHVAGDTRIDGECRATTYNVNGTAGATGTGTNVTVVNGIVTAIS